MSKGDEILTVDEVCAELKIHRATLWRFHKEGRGPAFFKVGAQYRYRRSDINAWLQNNPNN